MFARSLLRLATPFRGISAPTRLNLPFISQATTQRFCTSVEVEYKAEIAAIQKRYEDRKVRRQALVGTVVSTKNPKTLSVRVVHRRLITKYNKYVNVQKKVMAHDEEGRAKLGDLVRIIPCRPMSKRKHHSLIDIVKRPKTVVTKDGTELNSGGYIKKR